MLKPFISALTGALTLLLVTLGPALAERRVALVIGNAQYKNTNLSLPNPKNDAEDVAATLRTLGFEVVLATDTDKRALDLAVQQFARKVTDADSALFFYAGHAMQYQGRNYLMPTDAELEDDISLRYQMIAIDDVRAALDRSNGVKIMILDACRNNPLADRLARNMASQSRTVGNVRGLARVDKTQGMVVAYATAADDVAQDGTGRNSPFTAALLKRLQEPGVDVEIMFRRVAADVNSQTSGRQRPETYISLLSEYYLNQNDKNLWDQVKDTGDVAALREFVGKFPTSTYSVQAQSRLVTLDRAQRDQQADREKAQRESDELRSRLAMLERERAGRDQAERERAERERVERERAERERADRERADLQRTERETAERTRLARLEADRQAADRQAADRQAAERLARIETERKAGEVCTREEEQLARFERALACERLRPLVLAAIAAQAQEPRSRVVPRPGEPLAESPQLIRAAQIELRRIGCFAGNDDGQFSEPTRDAVRRYLTQRGLPSSDLKISEAFLAELRAQDKGVCPLECKRGQVEDNGRCVAEPAAEPRRAKHSSPSKSERAATPRRERERTVKREREEAPPRRAARAKPSVNDSYSNSPKAAAQTPSVQPSIGVGGFGGRLGIRIGR
jgi:uncharacterized caspase-like protein/peptidoglycan hydrolase-like protein with peptidoglycan-binding domain